MKNIQAECMDVWYKAFCCRHINVKTVSQLCIRIRPSPALKQRRGIRIGRGYEG